MSSIPHDKKLEASLDFLKYGYDFIHNKRKELKTDLFETRLMLQKVVCMGGEEAAKLFYDPKKFRRADAVPKRVQRTLVGENGVQTLDGDRHKHRKAMFMSMMIPGAIDNLLQLVRDGWEKRLMAWENEDEITLFDEVQVIICKAASQWAGMPVEEDELREKAKDYGALVDAFGAVGPRHWAGKAARSRLEDWVMERVEKARTNEIAIKEGTPAHLIIHFEDEDGSVLDKHIAAVEIMNVVRPIVAIATFITFSALALHDNPSTAQKISTGDNKEEYLEWFTQEVRRFYPFAPFTGARVAHDFQWNGYQFEEGTLVFLDLYGTNHDEKIWEKADAFMPERFATWQENAFTFIPQGGGHYHNGHRCREKELR